MIQAFYSSAVGAQQQMRRLDVHSNNISNVNTQGYKTQVPSFQTLMYGMVNGIDDTQLPRGSGAAISLTGTDMSAAAPVETGRDLDYAIIGEGFFALYDPATGEVSFTRDGSFILSSFGAPEEEEDPQVVPLDTAPDVTAPAADQDDTYYLSDGEGRQVLGPDGLPILVTDPNASPSIGVFSIQFQDGLERAGSSRFIMGAKNGAVWLSNAEVRQGFLESSNADLATELVGVIEAQRSYSYALKMVTTADEVESTINNLTNG